jgi:hypothetical protein
MRLFDIWKLTRNCSGGNDAELSEVLNQCIFEFFTWTKLQQYTAEIGKLLSDSFGWAKNIDWSKKAIGCLGQLDRANRIIESEEFSRRLDTLISKAKEKLQRE